MRKINVLLKGIAMNFLSFSLCEEIMERCLLWDGQWASIRYCIGWHLDLRLSILQNCEKYIFVIYKFPSLLCFVLVVCMDLDTCINENSVYFLGILGHLQGGNA